MIAGMATEGGVAHFLFYPRTYLQELSGMPSSHALALSYLWDPFLQGNG